ncbi:serine/threonine protein kinase, partial [Saccharophagus degradans]|nr:serine/threonine protein kinase [Saccharophagus degradans]
SAAEAVSDDNSGRLSYVIAEYTGAKINGDAEFNGFSFYTVGSGTTLDHLVVKYGFDDGVEFFGGTVDLNGILCVNIADDM